MTGQTRESQSYSCKNKGCPSGGRFEGAPIAWFRERGLSEPSNCPSCKAWKSAQTDEEIRCSACGNARRIPAGVKVMFHRHEGIWQTPSYCRPCESDPERRERAARRNRLRARRPRRDPRRLAARAQSAVARDVALISAAMSVHGGLPTRVASYSIPATPQGWQRLPHGAHGNRWNHTFYRSDGQGHARDLRQAFAVATDEQTVGALASLAARTNTSTTIQFAQVNGNIVKYDTETLVTLVISSEGKVVTAFPQSGAQVAARLSDGRWSPAR